MDEPTPQPRQQRRKWPFLLAAGVAVVAVMLAAVVVRGIQATRRPLPSFASLVESPDPSLQGTIAYYDGTTSCVRIIDASGSASKDAHCFDPPPGNGPVTGPHLAWRDDGRLEITAFSWPPEQEMTGAWQRLVDVDTGVVEAVPQAQVPQRPEPSPIPAVAPDGDELLAEVRDDRLVIELTENGETRSLLESDQGPSSSYFVGSGGQPVWSPDGQYVVLFDGRLLLTTVGDNSTTRILVDYPGENGFGCCWSSDEIRRFAVTDQTHLPNRGD
jgi:hypothetical protein